MGIEFLASRVKAANMPGRLSWWAMHGANWSRILARTGRNEPAPLDQARSVARAHACTWEAWMPQGLSRRFMERLVAYEIALIEAAHRSATSTIHRLEDLLVSNTYQQSDELGLKIKDFPVQRFRHLVLEHTWLFTRQVRHQIAKENGSDCAKKAQVNAVSLGAFTVEWF